MQKGHKEHKGLREVKVHKEVGDGAGDRATRGSRVHRAQSVRKAHKAQEVHKATAVRKEPPGGREQRVHKDFGDGGE